MHHGLIGVLAGGDSPEREVSLISGRSVSAALQEAGYRAVMLDIDSLDDVVPALSGIDIAFNVLHGGAGEDGTVALLLDVLEIPYPGSRPQACSLAMDKVRTREVLSRKGISVPPGRAYNGEKVDVFCANAVREFGFPLVVKPHNLGSSVGVHIVDTEADVVACAIDILNRFGPFLIEGYVPGRELTAGILHLEGEDQALPLIEIIPKDGFFDYSAKYTDGMADFLSPAHLTETEAERTSAAALAAHHATGCSGYSRVDLRLAPDGTPYILEVNTLPGMTPMSDLPRAAAAAGIDFTQLVQTMLATTNQGGK
jgi:D-alanine-D-alanine ligase